MSRNRASQRVELFSAPFFCAFATLFLLLFRDVGREGGEGRRPTLQICCNHRACIMGDWRASRFIIDHKHAPSFGDSVSSRLKHAPSFRESGSSF